MTGCHLIQSCFMSFLHVLKEAVKLDFYGALFTRPHVQNGQEV